MRTPRIFLLCLAAAWAVASAPAAASTLPATAPVRPDFAIPAGANCYSIGESIAAQQGGRLARATQAKRGGRTYCVIVVLVPGRDGQRPRRTEIVVPAD